MRKALIALATFMAVLAATVSYAQVPAARESAAGAVAQGRGGEAQPPVIYQTAKLTASDGVTGNDFGYTVAVWANTVVAAAPDQSPSGAYVFVKPETGWADMTETAKLTTTEGYAIWAVAVSGNTVVAADCTAAYVFVEPPTGWSGMTQTATLTASDDQGLCSVAISGRTIVAGAPGALGGEGEAYVFVEPETGWVNMTQNAILTSTDGTTNPGLGYSIAISGDTVLAGGGQGGEASAGAVWIFVEPAGGWVNMTETAELTPSDPVFDEGFGNDVGISGNTATVGAPNDVFNGKNWIGALYVFVEPEGGWANMTQTAKLTASDGGIDDQLGNSAAISGNWALGGAPQYEPFGHTGDGKAYLFHKPTTGWNNMLETVELKASDETECSAFGVGSRISGGTVVVGAAGRCANGGGTTGEPGAAYVFSLPQ